MVKSKVKISEEQADIDLETRDYHLYVLKKRADDALASEHSKHNMYTKQEYEEKVKNLAANYQVLRQLNREGNMAEFTRKLNLIKSPKDFYFSTYEHIEALHLE